ncbi:hypothetical protein JT359_06290 [Candidatus Poribacteria bacterium]|nr:hypothetical protein [Candidatus Poribacteria bacterium]
MRKHKNRSESGLTLVEMLTAVSVIVIMSGSSYAVFNTAIKVYQRTQSKIIQAKRSRYAFEQLFMDINQMQVDPSDEMLTLFSEDIPTPDGERDIISFITFVKSDPDPFSIQLPVNPDNITPPLSDIRRVVYYVGPKVPSQEIQNGNIPSPISNLGQIEEQTTPISEELVLYRVVSTALDPELVVSAIMDTGIIPTVDESGQPVFGFDVTPVIDGIINFDLKYIDEESMYESWDETDTTPIAIQILITIIDEDRQQSTSSTADTYSDSQMVTQQGALTQSSMVYIPASANVNADDQ